MRRLIQFAALCLLPVLEWIIQFKGRLAWRLIDEAEVRRRADGTPYVLLNGVPNPEAFETEDYV